MGLKLNNTGRLSQQQAPQSFGTDVLRLVKKELHPPQPKPTTGPVLWDYIPEELRYQLNALGRANDRAQ